MDTNTLIDTAAIAVRLSQFVDHLEEFEVMRIMRFLIEQHFEDQFWLALSQEWAGEIGIDEVGERVLTLSAEDQGIIWFNCEDYSLLGANKDGEPMIFSTSTSE